MDNVLHPAPVPLEMASLGSGHSTLSRGALRELHIRHTLHLEVRVLFHKQGTQKILVLSGGKSLYQTELHFLWKVTIYPRSPDFLAYAQTHVVTRGNKIRVWWGRTLQDKPRWQSSLAASQSQGSGGRRPEIQVQSPGASPRSPL